MLLAQLSGAIPNASVGGPLTIMIILLIAMLAVGIYEAWSNRRGPLGWIVNIVVAVVGGCVAGMIGGSAMDIVIPLLKIVFPFLKIEGSLAASQHPLLYVLLAAITAFTLFGSWLALQLVNRLRQ